MLADIPLEREREREEKEGPLPHCSSISKIFRGPKMKHSSCKLNLKFSILSCLLLFLLLLCFEGSVDAYKNYTVGDSLGWYDNLAEPDIDYQKWVAGKSFSLGDFLIFNTDNNHSVVQTYNFSTYKTCDYSGDDSTEWSTTDPSATTVYPITVAVPLLKEGETFFFSGDYDGWQCRHGQHFKINVTYGQGLPPSLKNAPDGSSPAPDQSPDPSPGDQESAPDTIIPSNFNNPKNSTDGGGGGDQDSKQSSSGSISTSEKTLSSVTSGVLILFGLCHIF